MFIMLGVVTATGFFHGELQINYHGVFWGWLLRYPMALLLFLLPTLQMVTVL